VSVHKYSGITVRISFLASVEQGYTMRSGFSLFYLELLVLSRHIG